MHTANKQPPIFTPGRFPRQQRWLLEAAALLGTAFLIGSVVVFQDHLPARWSFLILLGLAGAFGLLILGNLKKILLAVILIDIPLRWDIFLGARVQNAPLGMREGWLIAATSIALLALYAIFLIQELNKPGSHPPLRIWDNLPLLTYILFVFLSVLAARDTRGSLFQVFFLAQMFLLYLYVTSNVNTPGDVFFIVFFLIAGLSMESAVVLMQRFAGLRINQFGIVTVMDFGRMAGTLGSPNVAASYFSLLLVPAFSLFYTRLPALVRISGGAAFLIGSAALVLTVSRGGWIAFAISAALFGLALWARERVPTWVIILVMIVATLVLTLFGEALFDRLLGMRSSAAMARIPLMQIALRMIGANPLLGVGANNYAINIRSYLPAEISRSFLYVVHNKYLLVWAETGIGGILAFMGFLLVTIWRGWRCWQRNHPLFSPLALAFAAAITGQMAHMMIEIFDSRSQVQALWLVAALVCTMERITRTRPEASPPAFQTGDTHA